MRTVKIILNSNLDDASDDFLSAKRLHTRPPSCSTRAIFTDGPFIYVIDFFLKSNPVLDFFRPSCGFLIKNTTGITISHLKT